MFDRRLRGPRPRRLRFGNYEPETFRLVTLLTVEQCHARLDAAVLDLPWHSFFFGTTEQLRTWQREGRPVVGSVDEAGFELEQRVLESPIRRSRLARGNFEAMPNGTLIVYQIDMPLTSIGHPPIHSSDVFILTSALWKRFDREETALFLDFICGALDAELVSQDIIDELRRPQQPNVKVVLPGATPVDDFLAALDAVIQDSDDATC